MEIVHQLLHGGSSGHGISIILGTHQCQPSIYTDGSTSGGTRNGGTAAVVTRGSPIQPEVVTMIKTKGRSFTSSYKEEAASMESALSWASTNANYPSIAILFCIDSKSLCQALLSWNPRTYSIHNSINSISSSILIQWIPGYSDIPDSKLANKAAKEATTITTNTILPVSFSSTIQVIKEMIRNDQPTHKNVAQIYQHKKASCDLKEIRIKQMMYCLLVYILVNILLSVSIFISSTHLKIQSARNPVLKISLVGDANVQQLKP